MTDLAKEKKAMKSRRPDFKRTDSHKKKRLGEGWRSPRGWQNKMRLEKKGYRRIVKPGYGTPDVLRNTKEGLNIITIHNMNELNQLDQKTQAALIANVGRKKKEEIITAAKEKKIVLVNLPVEKYQEKTKAILSEKKAKKDALKAKEAAKEKKAKAAKAAQQEAEKEDAKKQEAAKEEQSDEEAKAAKKKEQDKILTNKKGM